MRQSSTDTEGGKASFKLNNTKVPFLRGTERASEYLLTADPHYVTAQLHHSSDKTRPARVFTDDES